MLFNSLTFAVFFPTVVVAYFLLPYRWRWAFLLAASYYFYMCWRPAYVLVILALTLVDYTAGLRIAAAADPRRRRLWLLASLSANLGMLFAFKYYNFFAGSLEAAFQRFNVLAALPEFKLLLPIGISFHTFQTISYTVEVYRRRVEPERHLGLFALYVAFFPQMVAGPIERGDALLPQLRRRNDFDYARARAGLARMLLGFFKKLVIADQAAKAVKVAFDVGGAHQNVELLLAAYLFSVQIYGDFSGYSDIAIGAAKVLGYDLRENFDHPYHARDLRDFWGRWHISLSTWFRDYLYIPLGGNRLGTLRQALNVFVVFLLSGLWHGANWTFVAWGAYHGLLLMAQTAWEWLRARLPRLPSVPGAVRLVATFHLVCLGFVIFRAASLGQAVFILRAIADVPRLVAASFVSYPLRPLLAAYLHVVLDAPGAPAALAGLLVLEAARAAQRGEPFEEFLARQPAWARWGAYSAALWALFLFGEYGAHPFIYFRF